MSERRPVKATLRVIIDGYAAEIEAEGTIDELVKLPNRLRAIGIEPGNSPLLWEGKPSQQPPAAAGGGRQGNRGRGRGRGNNPTSGDGPPCPVHGRAMLKSKHHRGYYCPEMLDDGSYCRERAVGPEQVAG